MLGGAVHALGNVAGRRALFLDGAGNAQSTRACGVRRWRGRWRKSPRPTASSPPARHGDLERDVLRGARGGADWPTSSTSAATTSRTSPAGLLPAAVPTSIVAFSAKANSVCAAILEIASTTEPMRAQRPRPTTEWRSGCARCRRLRIAPCRRSARGLTADFLDRAGQLFGGGDRDVHAPRRLPTTPTTRWTMRLRAVSSAASFKVAPVVVKATRKLP